MPMWPPAVVCLPKQMKSLRLGISELCKEVLSHTVVLCYIADFTVKFAWPPPFRQWPWPWVHADRPKKDCSFLFPLFQNHETAFPSFVLFWGCIYFSVGFVCCRPHCWSASTVTWQCVPIRERLRCHRGQEQLPGNRREAEVFCLSVFFEHAIELLIPVLTWHHFDWRRVTLKGS